MSLSDDIRRLCEEAKAASRFLALADSATKNTALLAVADALEAAEPEILAANAEDVAVAKQRGISAAMIDRLTLTSARLAGVATAVREIVALPDPVGGVINEWIRPNGLRMVKRRVPIGVIAVIYESRPNVTVDTAALCLKAGNATVLRGGSEAFRSNSALAKAFSAGLAKAGLPPACVRLVPSTDRDAVPALCGQVGLVDLVIPRGGHGLVRVVVENARVPVIKHYHGICHVYVDAAADFDMAEKIVVNAKCQRPGVCNAMETLLVDKAVAETFLPRIADALAVRKVELRAEPRALALAPGAVAATSDDFDTEHLDLILNVAVVDGVDGALAHIARHSSGHSESIVTADAAAAEKFLNAADSACVYWNASTRFTDGGEFGFGAEIGISTDKLHARGPMGLEELTTYKYQIFGDGQVRG
jgi:glutamate-5-semialdehyde dehydrogenase